MKIAKKILLFILIAIILVLTVLCIIGYSTYSSALKDEPLITKIDSITSQDNFVKFSDLAENYRNAVIAVEDHRFYDHGPVDFIAIARALYVNLTNWELREGGSTITQQVAKNVIFSQEETFTRKLGEIFAAYDLEKNYSKNEIFELYVNTMYFGDGYYNIHDAAEGYFDKEVQDMSLYESTLLAGIPNAPSVYSPTKNPDLAKQRHAQVLSKMVKYKYITQEEADKILNEM